MIKRLLKLSLLIIFAAALFIAWQWQAYDKFLQTPINITTTNNETTGFTVPKGASIKKIARELKNKKLINHPEYFEWYARINKKAEKIKAGQYSLKPGITPVELLDLFISGKVIQYSLTLVEGWTFKQIIQAINNNQYLVHTLADLTPQQIASKLELNRDNAEGLFFPDTYKFPVNTTDIDFLKRAHRTMEKVLQQEWQKRDNKLPLKNPYEALILASIVEKESGLHSERQKIAGVFIRRLQKKMRLQSDPTIIYGMGDKYKGNIRRRDIDTKTAYNTYQIDRLPPTPIAIPGRQAIYAVLHPDKGKSLYFVADGSGGHAFSNNLKAHNAAVRKYILKRK